MARNKFTSRDAIIYLPPGSNQIIFGVAREPPKLITMRDKLNKLLFCAGCGAENDRGREFISSLVRIMSITNKCRGCGQGFDVNNNPVGSSLSPRICAEGHTGPFDPMPAPGKYID